MTQLPTDPNPAPAPPQDEPGLDAAQQSLSDALRVSFGVLKVLMVVLVIVYVFSGVFRVDEQNTAVRYRFGERVGIYGPGWHFGLPFPIETVVMVPRNEQRLRLNESFWYDNPDDKKPEDLAYETLDPLKDSFLITGDTNVIHVQFEIAYIIEEQDVERYIRNVGDLDRADQLVRTAGERGMIHAIASTTVDDIVTRSKYPIDQIKFSAQQVLDELDTGIKIQQVLIDLKNQSMPNQVREAYNSVTQAQADKVKAIQEARRTFDETLGAAAGGSHEQLMVMIRAYEAALGVEDDALAERLRAELDRAIRDLRLPDEATLNTIAGYLSAVTDAAGQDDAQADARVEQAADAVEAALAVAPAGRTFGTRISGEVSATISGAKANRSRIATQAELDYERYASALQAYRVTPRVLANDRLQATRQAVMTGLVETNIGRFTRIETTGDPEVQEEIAADALQRRRDEAARRRAEQGQ